MSSSRGVGAGGAARARGRALPLGRAPHPPPALAPRAASSSVGPPRPGDSLHPGHVGKAWEGLPSKLGPRLKGADGLRGGSLAPWPSPAGSLGSWSWRVFGRGECPGRGGGSPVSRVACPSGRQGGEEEGNPADLDSEVRGREGAGSCSESLCPPDGASAPAEPLCSSLAPSPASQDQDDGRGIHRPAGRWPEPSAWVHGASEPAGPFAPRQGGDVVPPPRVEGSSCLVERGALVGEEALGSSCLVVLGVGPLTEGGGFLAWLESPFWPRDGWIASWVHCFLKPAWQGEASGRQGFCGAGGRRGRG